MTKTPACGLDDLVIYLRNMLKFPRKIYLATNKPIEIFRVCSHATSANAKRSGLFLNFGGHQSFFSGDWYYSFGLLARVDPSLVCFVTFAQHNPQINLWCDTC